MNKQILVVRKYKGFGGVEHQILNFTKALLNSGWKVFFLSDQASPFGRAMNEAGAITFVESLDNHFRAAKTIIKICRNNNIQIIQSHMLSEDFSCRIAKLLCHSLKHVFRVHTYIDCSRISRLKKNVYHMASFLTDSLVDVYLPINAVNAEEINKRSHIKMRKIVILHDSVRNMEKSPFDTSYAKNRVIAMIANFENGKGHDVLLEGVRILREHGEKVLVHLIGGVPGRGTDHENSERLDIVKRTIKDYSLESEIVIDGYCDNIPEAIKDCGLVVLPSDSEGTPNCLLEGMLLEKIVVASDVGGVSEFVIDGNTGFLHRPQDGGAFAEAILKVYSKTDEELKNIECNARNFVKDHFSMDMLLNNVIDVYSSLLS